MVNRLGLLFLLLSCEDDKTPNSILAEYKNSGLYWDDSDLAGEMERNGISLERPYLMRQLLRGPNGQRSETSEIESNGKKERSGWYQDHRPDEHLKECPFCGSEILHRDARTRLAHYVSRSELMLNKDVARAAGVPGPVVSELQHYSEGQMTPKRKAQVEAIDKVLDVPADMVLSFHPEGSTVCRDEGGATAPWPVWNDRP